VPKRRIEGPEGGHPAFVAGLVSFEFWNNDDETYRDKALRDLAHDCRERLNISAVMIVAGGEPESGRIAFSGAARNLSQAESLASDVMKFLDEKAPARIVGDNWIAEEIP